MPVPGQHDAQEKCKHDGGHADPNERPPIEHEYKKRPRQVELLFDRQRPEVPDRHKGVPPVERDVHVHEICPVPHLH